ncbi:MAG: Cyclohexanone monooxygenase [Frankiales bacterium]|nr:Cyclohexanone monooxygenase [Frankiales bacterium]
MPLEQEEAVESPITDHAEYDAVVVGAGFAGMYQLYRLRELGLSVRVLETGDGVGGTWYWNRYPGARVDSPSMQYSLSFSSEMEQEWGWPEDYSPQNDLERYANHVADRFNLRDDIQFGTRVTNASYDENTKKWTIETDRGDSLTAQYFITAVGCLSATNMPNFKNLESFQGEWYHTSRYPKEGVELKGKRVGIVGTGSTGIQAITAVGKEDCELFVFQRTPNYSLPSNNKPMDPEFEKEWKTRYAEHREAARVSQGGAEIIAYPSVSALAVSDEERAATYEKAWNQGAFTLAQSFTDLMTNEDANFTAAEFVRNKIRQTVKDPETAELLAPKDYPIFTKRICMDTGYYETFNRPNVHLVDVKANPIEEITPKGIKTSAGEFELDLIIFATGFDAMTGPLFRMNIAGKDGLTLKKKWEDGPKTYLGISSVGFPNMFMITGPGSPSVLSNMTTSIEQHVDWITDTIKYLKENELADIEPTAAAEDAWVEHVNEVANKTLYPKANSWYIGANIPGKPRVFMPYVGGVGNYRQKCDEVAAKGYEGFELTPA